MNALTFDLLWAAIQVTLFVLAGSVIYLAARRKGPAAGALAAAAALAMVIVVSALAFSPWPRWTMNRIGEKSAEQGSTTDSSDATNEHADDAPQPSEISDEEATDRATPRLKIDSGNESVYAAYWNGFIAGMNNLQAPAPEKRSWLPAWLAILLTAGAAVGVIRMGVGLAVVARYRRHSRRIEDTELLRLIESVSHELNCRATVEPRESHEINSPATIGWRRPLLLLPLDWRSWTIDERRVVIAHELAHVARGDYLTWLIAQASLALHFYHPLVHWLAGRLRVEQEMAADSLGASVAGGRAAYVETLARMALRADDRRLSWAARPFLPDRGAFLRRINMLRNTNTASSRPIGAPTRAALLVLLIAAGVLIAGLRAPNNPALAQTEDAQTATQPADIANESTLDYVPKNATFVLAIRPADILSTGPLKKIEWTTEEQKAFEDLFKAPLTSVKQWQQVTFAITILENRTADEILIIRGVAPLAVEDFANARFGRTKEASHSGRKYLKGSEVPDSAINFVHHLNSAYQADDHTVIVGREDSIRRVIDTPEVSKLDTRQASWDAVSSDHLAVMIDPSRIPVSSPPGGGVNAMLAPLITETDRAVAGLSLNKGSLALRANIHAKSEAGATNIAKTVEAVLTLANNAMPTMRKAFEPNAQHSAARTQLVLKAFELQERAMENVAITTEGRRVALKAEAEVGDLVGFVPQLLPALTEARTAARRSQSSNNLKQILLAMNYYHDAEGHFPPSIIVGPDGKTPHSWRVAILPFLGYKVLYDEYKLDEPWDSPNNLKVLEKMPAVYRHPAADSTKDGFTTSYFVLTGDKLPFSDQPQEKGIGLKDIADGTSNTLAVVEAKRDVPWTKPEDIPVDLDKELPELGGFFEEGFHAARFDGSVQLFPSSMKPESLKKFLTHAGREPIKGQFDEQQRAAPRQAVRASPN